MTTIKIILAVIFIGAVGALIRLNLRRQDVPIEPVPEKLAVQKSAAESSVDKPSGSDVEPVEAYVPEPAGHETSDDLSDSGAVSIRAEIDRCVAAQLWPEAIKWAIHATHALPDHDAFQVTLAEIYAKSDDREKFVPLFAKLYIDLDNNPIEQSRLLQIAAAFIPDDPLVAATLRDAGVGK